MRTIKFRGQFVYKNTQTGENDWVYGDLVQYPEHIGKHRIVNEGINREVLAYTVGQFTGLHDKNGKEIYEGDIIRSFDSKGESVIHYIQYDDEEAGFVAAFKGSRKGDFGYGRCDQRWITNCEKEVIGNIHDNLELLK